MAARMGHVKCEAVMGTLARVLRLSENQLWTLLALLIVAAIVVIGALAAL
jgi:hypothetical protein